MESLEQVLEPDGLLKGIGYFCNFNSEVFLANTSMATVGEAFVTPIWNPNVTPARRLVKK